MYIEGPDFNKGKFLVEVYEARKITKAEAAKIVAQQDSTEAVVIVVETPTHDAAGYAYDTTRFQYMTDPKDDRPMEFFAMDKELVNRLTGYDKHQS